MEHADHVRLLRGGVPEGSAGPWADLGSGTGAFTLALADLLGPAATIYSVDRSPAALAEQRRAMDAAFPQAHVTYHVADMTGPLEFPPLEGIVLANALHFVREQEAWVRRLCGLLRPGGRLVLVEYNAARGNPWVPYPLTSAAWEQLARRAGFATTRQLATVPSRFLREIYSAVSTL